MDVTGLRVALFSGNYNYVRDGANQALNRFVGYLLRQGAQVRVYAPTTDTPAFPPTGDLVSAPSIPVPGRPEYRIPTRLSRALRRDLKAFAPNMIHLSSPDPLGHRALTWARDHDLPAVASVHTRFETYPRYYGLAFLEPAIEGILRRFYRRCDAIVAPSESMAQLLREQRMSYDVGIWTRGIDREIFTPQRRDLDWRRSLGFADDVPVIGFIGRQVMEKGLDVFSDTIDQLTARKVPHKVLVVGEGPAREWFQNRLPDAVFTGFQGGADLGRAVASMDMLFNPSVTETFGNVTLEAMACRLPTVAARATGSENLVQEGITGRLIRPGAIGKFADALQIYCTDAAARASAGAAAEAQAEHFGWDQVNQALVDTYLRIIRQRAQGAKIRSSPVP
ncbi:MULTISPECIES: glycosyltransferase family 4 protein [Sphingobium]|jgi:glycosyltransferase involved in cell wall biosynthesis|uniref:Glycosyltransferase family 1 protein n=1 Tax=Sphingobium yanoikuyae TaxID=13690 RepID=A0A430C690_SPHYA|nr:MULTISPECIES: glycosyltransferase family 1 protein [Sphingobium]MBR2267869.1 glycosyltransferase family 1 protein [Sphingobium sp.]RSU60421.1 glycosyltransferase family 1 protein [Sphingobium yanoikuyae]WBQ18110.1 glycosyltransferase family 1 protein [Sphingobium yanoikuyae]SHM26536.1 Glycosyltransferase involved in cell wall bisynthesis [Sphingobium sp. YR657]